MLNSTLSLSNSSLMNIDLSCFEGKESEQNWEERDRLFKKLIDYYSSAEEKQLVTNRLPELLTCLHTPRTQLMNSACLFMQCIAQHSIMNESQQELILSNLIKLMTSTKKIAAIAAVNAAKPVCHLMRTDRFLNTLLQGFLDKNASLRARLMELVEEMFLNVYNEEVFAIIMKKAITDANSEVRQRAGKIFQILETNDPIWTESFSDGLDVSTRKQLSQLRCKSLKNVQEQTKPDLISIISQQRAGIVKDPKISSSPSMNEDAQTLEQVKQTTDEIDDEIILQIKRNAIKPVVDALPRLSIDDIEPPIENATEVEMIPIRTLSPPKKPENYSILLGSPRKRIDSLGLAMSTPMRRILDESNKSPQRRSSPLPLSIFELLMKRVEEDAPSRLSSLHKLNLMTINNDGDGCTDMVSIWNVNNLGIFLNLLDKTIKSFDRLVLGALEVTVNLLKRLCLWYKDEIISAGAFAVTMKCLSHIHCKCSTDKDWWDAVTELLVAQADPTDIIWLTSDTNQFMIRCSQLWLIKHSQKAVAFLHEISASIILAMNHPDTVVRKSALEFFVSAKEICGEVSFENVVACNLTTHQKRLIHTYSMNQ